MAWFGFGVLAVLLLWLGARAFLNADPRVLAKAIKLAAALACGALAVFFLVRGRVDAAMMLGFAAAGIMGYLPRGLSFFGGLFGRGGLLGRRGLGSGWSRARTGYSSGPSGPSAGGQQSSVNTAWLRMWLDHATGRMDGDIMQGAHAGSRLSSLPFEVVIELLRECQRADNQSAALLEAYLDRMAGEDWRERAKAQSGASSGNAGETRPGAGMGREQAYEILGLKPGATAEAVKAAHRRLMKKFHPDQGGSTHLAAQINQAKDLLLGE